MISKSDVTVLVLVDVAMSSARILKPDDTVRAPEGGATTAAKNSKPDATALALVAGERSLKPGVTVLALVVGERSLKPGVMVLVRVVVVRTDGTIWKQGGTAPAPVVVARTDAMN